VPQDEHSRSNVSASLLLVARDERLGPRLSIGELVDALGDQGFGLLLLILTLPNLVPGPMIPGFSVPFALGIAALGLQRFMGFEAPRLPQWIRRRTMSRAGFRRLIERCEIWLRRAGRLLRQRPNWLTHGPGRRLVGLTLVGLSLVLALPVPLGNSPMGFSIGIIALGVLENDGLMLGWGLGAGALAAIWNGLILLAGEQLFVAITHLH